MLNAWNLTLMIHIVAYQVAENIHIKKFKVEYTGDLINSTSFELFYKYNTGYIYVLNYGVVVFANIEEIFRSTFISHLKSYCENLLEKRYQEDFNIYESQEKNPVFSYNTLAVPKIDDNLIRIAMLQVAQPTALDFYLERSQQLVDETVKLTDQLEKHGKLLITRRSLLRFIGKTLNTKNRIIDSLYVFDADPLVWENELLGSVNDGLVKTFDIHTRFKELEYMLKNVESNLSTFIELNDANTSHRLEWIIIILILFEVGHLVFTWF